MTYVRCLCLHFLEASVGRVGAWESGKQPGGVGVGGQGQRMSLRSTKTGMLSDSRSGSN